jgi:pimeloyl-ACP methyl ester carboxylesterase
MTRSIKIFLSAAAALLTQAAAFAESSEREVRLDSAGGVALTGALSLPDGPGPHPAVILLSGSGPQDRDSWSPDIGAHRPFADWATHLSARGYVVLRLDDRGVGGSGGAYQDATAADLAADAASALAWLRRDSGLAIDEAGYLGHSEGGAVAMLANQSEHADFVIMLAGPAVDFREVFSGQYRAQQLASGDSAANIDANQDFLSAVYATLDAHESSPQPEARAALGATFDRLGIPQEAGADVLASDQYRFWVAHDMRAQIRAVDAPILGLYAEHDVAVHPLQNAASLIGLIDPANGSLVRVLPGVNHMSQSADSPLTGIAEAPHAVSPEVMTYVADWLDARTS